MNISNGSSAPRGGRGIFEYLTPPRRQNCIHASCTTCTNLFALFLLSLSPHLSLSLSLLVCLDCLSCMCRVPQLSHSSYGMRREASP